MKTPNVFIPVTPMMKRTPTFSRPRKLFSPNGMTANTSSTGMARKRGAMWNTTRSAGSGTTSSFERSFRMSAKGWNRPKGPQRFGPSRDWNLPSARRSNQV